MPYKSILVDRVYIVRWVNAALVADIKAVIAEMEAAVKKENQPIIGIAIVPIDFSPIDSDLRKITGDNMRQIVDASESLHYVIEGAGFKNSILRSMVTNIIMLIGKRGKIMVHGTLEAALASLSPRLKELDITIERVLLAAQTKGVSVLHPSQQAASRPAPRAPGNP